MIQTNETTAREEAAEARRVRDPLSGWLKHKGRSILNPEKVRQIRADYATGEYTHAALAALNGTHKATIGRLITGSRWAWVGGEIREPRVRRPLTLLDVRVIRAEYKGREWTRADVGDLAKKYGADRYTIRGVLTGRTYCWFEPWEALQGKDR